ncbi:amino acid permease, partial [Escherichia coli]|uniref:amino acid permease n=1 Tax=Escherichia coli TaxID=562 RepID=UPI003A0FB9D4
MSALGIPEARHIVNFVVLTSVCSCFNSALYTCSRMMFSLSKRGDAPIAFSQTNRNSSPWVGVIFSSIFSIVAVYLTA